MGPATVYFQPDLFWNSPRDMAWQTAIEVLVQGKFITIFAFLFGLGFAVQWERARDAGLARRRSLWLFLLGLAHALLLWFGDILHTYGLAGLATIPLLRRSENTILRWAVALYWFAVVLGLLFLAAISLGAKIPMPEPPTAAELADHVRIFSSGSVGEIFVRRAKDFAGIGAGFLFAFTRVLGMMLFGAWVWRRGILRDLDEHAALLRKVRNFGLTAGLAGNLAAVAIVKIFQPPFMAPTPVGLAVMIVLSLAVPVFAAGYACAVLLWFRTETGRRWLDPFRAVGRMALTNYLLQSLICTTIFYSYGFGLFGGVSIPTGVAIAVLVFAAQVPFSVLWLRNHDYGPMEALWRHLTYGAQSR